MKRRERGLLERATGLYLLARTTSLIEVILAFGVVFAYAGVWMLLTGRAPIIESLEAMAKEEERRRQSHEGLA
jgi:hypothetical protein